MSKSLRPWVKKLVLIYNTKRTNDKRKSLQIGPYQNLCFNFQKIKTARMGEKYLQVRCQIRNLYLEHIKNFYTSIIK